MTDRPKSTFAKRVRAAKPRARKYEIHDDVITGLTVRIYPSGNRTFALVRMTRGRTQSARIGDANEMTIPEARREARSLIASYIVPAKKDNGPRIPGRPIGEFVEEFLERHGRHWKPRTLDTNRRLIREHILPAFGHMTVDAIEADDVRSWFASMGERPRSANRSMPVLSIMTRMAELWGYHAHNTNPCKRTRRYRMKPRERFLTAEDMARLNAVLTRDEFRCPDVVAIVRLLMPTGCRFGEIASLEWDWIRGKRIFLPDSKSGPRTVGCRAQRGPSSTPFRATARIARISFRLARRPSPSTTSRPNGTASGRRRRECPDCGFTTFAIAGRRSPP